MHRRMLTTYHRYQSIDQIISKMGRCNLGVGTAHLVHVTHINDPHSFYVRLASLRYAPILLQVHGDPVTQDDLEVGKYIVYNSENADELARGCIMRIDYSKEDLGTVCAIFAIDFGCIDEDVPLSDIFKPVKVTTACGPLAIHCELNACEPLGPYFSPETVQAMKFFVGKYTSKIIITFKDDEKLKVMLKTVECRDDVSTRLSMLGFSSFTILANQPNPQRAQYKYRHQKLSAGVKIHARVQSGSTIFGFFVAEVSSYHIYDDVIEWYNFTKYCMEQPPLDIIAAARDGRACGVKVENPVRYERAYITRITVPGSKALVQLIDWGKLMEVNFEDIKPVTDRFLRRRALAIYCAADRLECLNNGLGLRMMYPGLEFLVEIVEPGNGFLIPHRVRLEPLFHRPHFIQHHAMWANNYNPPPLVRDDSEEDE